jgi:hypothetical protein
MPSTKNKNVATLALGMVQSETEPPGVTYLNLISGTPLSMFVQVRNAAAAKQLVAALAPHN